MRVGPFEVATAQIPTVSFSILDGRPEKIRERALTQWLQRIRDVWECTWDLVYCDKLDGSEPVLLVLFYDGLANYMLIFEMASHWSR